MPAAGTNAYTSPKTSKRVEWQWKAVESKNNQMTVKKTLSEDIFAGDFCFHFAKTQGISFHFSALQETEGCLFWRTSALAFKVELFCILKKVYSISKYFLKNGNMERDDTVWILVSEGDIFKVVEKTAGDRENMKTEKRKRNVQKTLRKKPGRPTASEIEGGVGKTNKLRTKEIEG